jgi:hypothetical protein
LVTPIRSNFRFGFDLQIVPSELLPRTYKRPTQQSAQTNQQIHTINEPSSNVSSSQQGSSKFSTLSTLKQRSHGASNGHESIGRRYFPVHVGKQLAIEPLHIVVVRSSEGTAGTRALHVARLTLLIPGYQTKKIRPGAFHV